MKQIKPDYYDKFICVASECSYTCCQQWAIAVDDHTRAKWKKLQVPAQMRETQEACPKPCCNRPDGANADAKEKYLHQYVCPAEGGGYKIKLNQKQECPLLDEQKLCHVVKAYGEETISHTCHTFPRECQRYLDREEHSLDIGCPEVLRLLWKKDQFKIEKTVLGGAVDRNCKPASPLLMEIRSRLIQLLGWDQPGGDETYLISGMALEGGTGGRAGPHLTVRYQPYAGV